MERSHGEFFYHRNNYNCIIPDVVCTLVKAGLRVSSPTSVLKRSSYLQFAPVLSMVVPGRMPVAVPNIICWPVTLVLFDPSSTL